MKIEIISDMVNNAITEREIKMRVSGVKLVTMSPKSDRIIGITDDFGSAWSFTFFRGDFEMSSKSETEHEVKVKLKWISYEYFCQDLVEAIDSSVTKRGLK